MNPVAPPSPPRPPRLCPSCQTPMLAEGIDEKLTKYRCPKGCGTAETRDSAGRRLLVDSPVPKKPFLCG